MPILGDVTLLGVTSDLKRKYGDFGVVVFDRVGQRKRAQQNDGDVPIWSAGKYYGNVALTWFHSTRETTEQWDRLDAALLRLNAKRL